MAGSWWYDAALRPLEALGLSRRRRRLVAGLTGRVLEIGVGTGLLLPHYPPGAAVVAIDIDATGFARARARRPSVRLVRADAERLPFADASFDAVVAALAFCSVPDPERGLAEVRRVLRPGGALRLFEHVRPPGALGVVFDRLDPLWYRLNGSCHLDRRTDRAVLAAGFRVRDATTSCADVGWMVDAERP